jgi:predicted acylesterase/phospholipase RssA
VSTADVERIGVASARIAHIIESRCRDLNEDLNDGLGSGTVCRFAAMSGLEHVLASGALPPAFAPVEIDGEYYWDGGIVSNTPLWYAVDHSPAVNVLIVQVDLFSAEGELPQNLDQVMERHKDIMYSSKTRFDTTHVRENQAFHDLAMHRRAAAVFPLRFSTGAR